MSLGPAEKSRIPTYYAGGVEVAKVAPYSPAKVAGIEKRKGPKKEAPPQYLWVKSERFGDVEVAFF